MSVEERVDHAQCYDSAYKFTVLAGRLIPSFSDILKSIFMEAKSNRLREATVRLRLYFTGHFLTWLQDHGFTRLENVRAEDVKAYFAEDKRGRNSIASATIVLRQVFKVNLNRVDLAEAVPRLRQRYDDEYEVLTEDDIAAMLKATDKLQWQLRLLMLWETGARPGEICSLRLQDVKLDNYGATVALRGKTLPRMRRLIESVKLLEKYLHGHPWRDDLGAPLFYAERGRRAESLTIGALYYMVSWLAKRASIKKKVWTHLIRHSAATRDAALFTGWELNQLNGWTKKSRTSDRYVHKLDERKLELKQLRLAGIQVPEEELKSPLAPRVCPRCNEQNTPLAKYCVRCSMVLDPKIAKELQAREDKAKGVLNILVNDKEFFDLMVQKIREKGLDQQ